MITRSLKIVIALATVCLASVEAEAQVTASSFSSGGTAISTARGRGNTRLNATAIASEGGYARADMRGSGRNGGFASGNSTAIGVGGVAISKGRSHANGWGARSHADSAALSMGGFSRSKSTAIANGSWSNAASDSISIADYGQYSSSSSKAIDNRWNSGPVYGTNPPPTYSTPTRSPSTRLSPHTAVSRSIGSERNEPSRRTDSPPAACSVADSGDKAKPSQSTQAASDVASEAACSRFQHDKSLRVADSDDSLGLVSRIGLLVP